MNDLLQGIYGISWQMLVMWVVGAVLIYLAIKKEMEPTLLLPMGFGAILMNLPMPEISEAAKAALGSGAGDAYAGVAKVLEDLFNAGIANELFPLLLFIGIGAMIDFGPLLSNPRLLLFGAAAQFGIFFTLIFAGYVFGFDIKDAGAIGIIGAADGPTSILVANEFGSQYLGAITVAAYSYMALVPIVQPPFIKLVTTRKERLIRMPYNPKQVTRTTRILFPIIVTVIAGLIAPASAALVGFLMFGNLLRECLVVNSLSDAAQNVLARLISLLLGLSVAFKMEARFFLDIDTIIIMCLGLVAFVFDTVGGVLFAKFLNLFLKQKINPMIGAAGISAFPMSSRVVHKMGLAEDPNNFLLMHAAGANVAGQIASVIAGGMILALIAH